MYQLIESDEVRIEDNTYINQLLRLNLRFLTREQVGCSSWEGKGVLVVLGIAGNWGSTGVETGVGKPYSTWAAGL